MNIENNGDLLNDLSEKERISLLEEKLKIARYKQKVGEVIVSKKVMTKVVNIPIRREKLVIKRIGKNPQELAEVTISEGSVNGFNYDELNHGDRLENQKSNFLTLTAAKDLLAAIAKIELTGNTKIRLEIVNNCPEDTSKIAQLITNN